MPSILSLEASTPVCSVALYHNGVTQGLFESAPKSHTQKMLPMAHQLLESQQLEVSALDAIAFACGPGSFTGLRIATSVAQGLAFGADLPVIPVSTLESMAVGARNQGILQEAHVCVTCLDAKMDEVYLAFWQATDTGIEPLSSECLIRPEDWLDNANFLIDQPIVMIGDGVDLLDSKHTRVANHVIHLDAHYVPQAKYVSELAVKAWHEGKTIAPELAEPTYLRGKSAWKTVAEQGKS